MSRRRCAAFVAFLFFFLLPPGLTAQDVNALKTEARALMKAGRYAAAIPVYQKALSQAEQAYGRNNYSTIIVVNELAGAYEANGEYARAVPHFERCITALETERGPEDSEVGTALNNLGVVYQNLAEYGKAEGSFLRSLTIGRRNYGADSPENASELNNLAGLYKEMGEYAKAEPLYLEAVRLYESSRSDKLPTGLLNLAGLYREMGQYDKALPLYERSLKIREAKFGPNHPDVGSSLNSLGQFYRSKVDLPHAEAFFQRALKVREAALGPDHPAVATTLNNLGSTYEAQGRFAESEPLYRRSLSIRQKKLGPDHPDLASAMNNLAGLLNLVGKPEEAESMYRQAIVLLERQPQVSAGSVSLLVGNLASLQAGQENWDAAAASYDKSRRIVRNYVSTVLPALGEREQLAFLRARDSKGFHAALSFGLARSSDPTVAAKSAEWLINGKAVTHEALSKRVGLPETTSAIRDTWVSLDAVRNALPPEAVLVEIAAFPVRNFAARTLKDRWQPPRYAAWIVPPAGRGDVVVVDLGPADQIDTFVTAARSALTESVQLVRTDGEPDAEQSAIKALQPLSESILQPLLAAAGDASRLIISPDASLWIVPWAALPLADSSYAVEKYEISHVVCGRDLATPVPETQPGRSMIFADPNYDLIPAEARKLMLSLLGGILPRVAQFAPSLKLPAVARLAGTASEAAAIAPKIAAYAAQEPYLYQQGYAQELIVKLVRQPQVLVISTHGFFLEQQIAAPEDESASSTTTPRAADGKPLENPLLRCGLLMAGCNQGTTGEDGILTGLEIVGINLRGTRLVVLSACETGLGRIQNGEGVAGLRQAFQLAGARAVVASLWPVEDKSTARLMTAFFGNLAVDKAASAALREAQLEIIKTRRERNGGAHPFFWSAFNVTEAR